jgi:hypothetical protein
MRKLLFLAVLGGVAYGLRKLYEDAGQQTQGPDHERAERERRGGGQRLAHRPRGTEAVSRTDDERLDEALRETFPASDPPAIGPRRFT